MTDTTLPAVVADSPNCQSDRDLVNQIIGQVQMAGALAKFSLTVSTSRLAYIKETKLYRHLCDQPASKSANVGTFDGTWEGFCTAIGVSRQKADEDIANLRAFGEEAMESLSRIGVGYRELQQLRRLPENERAALAEAAQNGDKESFLDLVDALVAKAVKEKEALAACAAEQREVLEDEKRELAEELAAAHRREANLGATVELHAGKIRQLESKERLTHFLPETEAVRAECLALQAEAELSIGALSKLFERCVGDMGRDGEARLRLEHVWIAAHAIAARALDLIEYIRRQGLESLPDRPRGEHILTADEAQQWLRNYQLIQGQHDARAALRQSQRDAAKPRGRGRPPGSKNKTEVGDEV
jgi:hypothetical protein